MAFWFTSSKFPNNILCLDIPNSKFPAGTQYCTLIVCIQILLIHIRLVNHGPVIMCVYMYMFENYGYILFTQGVLIFLFHVIRNDKIWSKLSKFLKSGFGEMFSFHRKDTASTGYKVKYRIYTCTYVHI